ncbi:DNA-binding transcriptional regulator, LacI/PurR family [Terrimicrobium sacchariphilum]|uniref:DNA-binding transcriptional regulator, LacI/PurR family n=2 Tax=Terrimicrobium sacchariphilum TaxID=690879 RepID=A0A146G470_TERSA|nr:DNA-binding transcriptional regulator, LacI/PurR family [Terrimicrobium sacchariphilum]
MKRKSTMAEVAKLAGVSASVVSYVLNGRAVEMRIPSATQERVMEACRELDYRRDYLASAMAGKRTKVIGVLFCNSRGDFMSDILSGIYDVLRENDHQVALTIVDDNVNIERADLESLIHRRVDGIVAFPIWETRPGDHWRKAVDSGIPVMFLNIVPNGVNAPSIDIDNFQGGREAARLAVQNGCEEAVMYECTTGTPGLSARDAGFAHEIRQLGVPLRRIPMSSTGEALAECLVSAEKVTGFFVSRASDFVPPLRRLVEEGVEFDSRHVFVTIGSAPEAHFIANPWFMLPHPARQMGRLAAAKLLESIRNENCPIEKIVLPHHWTANAAARELLAGDVPITEERQTRSL